MSVSGVARTGVPETTVADEPDALYLHYLGLQPKQGNLAPEPVTEAQVEALLAAPDTGTALGLRDRAMLEVLYATGLRVSELVGLLTVEVSMTDGVVRIVGKGNKERLVPLGEEARHWLERFMRSGRAEILGARVADAIFVTGRRSSRRST